ncbi:hypothetical protein OD91_1442 [Lutibacter sp. Hel_I_33_5]|uniref:DUF6503 family protein n=1 Tax=Lutibacter sp. Hel_I_33_5 TaxID=1566289 RepID=UPI0011A2198D|nr:DUF6503 family protein [Lutibacter sp. Hel_I_33_5]TVZ56162.1 hypothetical protein OD91_1442 [Lutibacter sp. Hel_I_33_5]
MTRFFFFLLIIFFGCNQKPSLTSKQILEKSIKKHDPYNNLKSLKFKLRIQEPRINNPERLSIVTLNNSTGEFELQRNRDTHISTHKIDKNGDAITFLDDKIEKDSLLIKKYRLQPKRNSNYRRFYQTFSLLPMSLKNEKFDLNDNVVVVDFNSKKAFKLSIELQKPIFSKSLNLFFSKSDYQFLGLEIMYPENSGREGQRVIFDGVFNIVDVNFSRFHHWLNLKNEYLGSDIFVKELK